MSCRTKCCMTFVFVLLALAILAAPAFAQTCLQDEYTASGGGSVVCTANDVQLAQVKNVQVIGGVGNKCLAGTKFSFLADFEVVTTSNKTRSNIGLYFGTAQNNALSGTCTDAIISPPHPCPANSSITCGSDHYDELDPSPDNCGDTSSQDTSTTYPGISGAQGVVIEIDNATCPTSGTTLSLPECTSWQVPGKQLFCQSPASSYPYQTSAVPGSPSKCSCGVLSVPVQPIEPSVTVAKSCNTTLSTGTGLTSCDAGAEGSTVTYTVTITNTTPAGEGGVVIDQVCDNQYGNLFTASGFAACPSAPLSANLVSGSSTCGSLGTIANGNSGTCTFQATQGELATVINHVTVQGHSELSTSAAFTPTKSNDVTVKSEDAPSSATVTKSLDSTTAACATVRLGLDVHNGSGFDEVETLNQLHDSVAGIIASTTASKSANVLATNCVVPQTINPGKDYTCTFDVQFCGNTGPVEEFGTGVCTTGTCTQGKTGSCTKNSDCDLTCAVGITQTDTVDGTIVDGETNPTESGVVVTQVDHGLTVNECLQSFTSSN